MWLDWGHQTEAEALGKGEKNRPPHLPILQTPNLLHVLCTTQPNQEPEGKIGLPGCRGGWERMALGSGGANNEPAFLHSPESSVG